MSQHPMGQHSTTTFRRLAVFCGASPGAKPIYTQIARDVGTLMAERGIGLVFGGGKVGLMGATADAVLAGGGEVIGVIPRLLEEREVAHRGLSELQIVETMHERKRRMYAMSDAMIALPGGIGTFEEIFEALTWNQLGLHDKPCGLLNVDGYYDPLVAMLEQAVDQGFVHRPRAQWLHVSDDIEVLLTLLAGE